MPKIKKPGIQLAVEAVGGDAKLASLLGVSRQGVRDMRLKGHAPPGRCVEIETLTGVPRDQLIDPALKDLLAKPFEG